MSKKFKILTFLLLIFINLKTNSFAGWQVILTNNTAYLTSIFFID